VFAVEVAFMSEIPNNQEGRVKRNRLLNAHVAEAFGQIQNCPTRVRVSKELLNFFPLNVEASPEEFNPKTNNLRVQETAFLAVKVGFSRVTVQCCFKNCSAASGAFFKRQLQHFFCHGQRYHCIPEAIMAK
jgi:hypothetical protein